MTEPPAGEVEKRSRDDHSQVGKSNVSNDEPCTKKNRVETEVSNQQIQRVSNRDGISNHNSKKRDQNWDNQFDALLAYSAKYNHCNVRPGYTVNLDDKVGVNLYAWLALQRRHKLHNKLQPDRLRKLQFLVDAAKLSWSASDYDDDIIVDNEYVHVLPPPPPPSWDSHYDALLVYSEANGHANVPMGYIFMIDGRTKIDLGRWLEDQRRAKIRNILEGRQLRRLDNLAREGKLCWLTKEASLAASVPEKTLHEQWQEKYEAIKAYVALHPAGCMGDAIDVRLRVELPPNQPPSNPFDLFQWVRAQRMCYFYKTLRPYRQQLLQDLVDQNLFSWMSTDEINSRKQREIEKNHEESILWMAWYNALVWLGNNRGECNLNSHGTITLPDGSEAELGKWLHIQKKYIKKGTLSIDRCLKLLQLVQEKKLDRGYWVKCFHLSYPPGTFVSQFPELFPGQTHLIQSGESTVEEEKKEEFENSTNNMETTKATNSIPNNSSCNDSTRDHDIECTSSTTI